MFLSYFDILILKINLKNKKNVFKYNHNYNPKTDIINHDFNF
jgi:hypothetical protein